MARIFPFRGYRYDAQRFELARVLTQPYDKITPEMQERYYALDPHNLVRVEKGRAQPGDAPEDNVYTRAAHTLDAWIREGSLRRDAAPSLYVCSQEFKLPSALPPHREGERRVRRGVLALAGLEDYSSGVVLRHEQTLAGPRADRLELLRHTRAHTGQIFMLFDDAEDRVSALLSRAMRAAPENELTDEFGVVHRLWPVSEPQEVQAFVSALADKQLLIADGHHRYETALAFRDECRASAPAARGEFSVPYEKILVTLFPLQDSGVVVLPTHRAVRGIPGFDFPAFRKSLEGVFDWYAYPFTSDAERKSALAELRHDLAAREKGPAGLRALGAYAGGNVFFLFVLRRMADLATLLEAVPAPQRSLDVVLLHRLLLEKKLGVTPEAVEREQNITYHREAEEACAAVDRGQAQIAFLLNPVPVRQVYELAAAGSVLPQKSTDFYPKLLSGLVLYRLED